LKKLGHILGPGECFPHFADLIFFLLLLFFPRAWGWFSVKILSLYKVSDPLSSCFCSSTSLQYTRSRGWSWIRIWGVELGRFRDQGVELCGFSYM